MEKRGARETETERTQGENHVDTNEGSTHEPQMKR